MFFRQKKSGDRVYLQIVENRWEDGRARQRVVATLGRLDELQGSGDLARLLSSGSKYEETLLLLSAHERGETVTVSTRRVGPALVFERLWEETGCRAVVQSLLAGRAFEFSVERAIFLTVLNRLFEPGSDRACDRWRVAYAVEGAEDLRLHHLYRAMAWLGEELPPAGQVGRTPFAPRCTKDLIEEALFARRRDLFSSLDLVFFDTTSIYFEGEGGETLGRRGKSKDHRPDLKQMVVGAVLDGQGHPICCEMWPGNTTDVRTLIPVVDRLRARFAIGNVCVVADRGMISAETIEELERRGWKYILGARMRADGEVRDEVVSRAGRYHVVRGARRRSGDRSPLRVKEVYVGEQRYVVCFNEERARKDAADREAIIVALHEQLQRGEKSLVGNKGFRRFLRADGAVFQVDEAKARNEARYDGKWVLRTNTDLEPGEAALRYMQLESVEDIFRTGKSLLRTRPIFHQADETIRGHVFCSFLALVLRKELQDRLEARCTSAEWADVIRDLDALVETDVEKDGKRFVLRSAARGTCGRVFQTTGVALPPTIRRADDRTAL
jgi:hypothetical protein